MKRIDVTLNGDDELSQQIQSDEMLYKTWNRAVASDHFEWIIYLIDQQFIYTKDQLNYIQEEFDEELDKY